MPGYGAAVSSRMPRRVVDAPPNIESEHASYRNHAAPFGTSGMDRGMTASTLISSSRGRTAGNAKQIGATVLALVAWFPLYSQLQALSEWIVGALPIEPGSHLAEAVTFFVFDTPKVLMLLALVVFAMGVVRSFFSPERTRAFLAGKREGLGNIAAAGLGIFTPFCSCSAVPLFVGFVSAGVPLGVTFSFLIAAPMINEVALGLLFALAAASQRRPYLAVSFGMSSHKVLNGIPRTGNFAFRHWPEAQNRLEPESNGCRDRHIELARPRHR
jgi:hypothetical protein